MTPNSTGADDVRAYGLDWQYDEPLWVHVAERDEGTVLFGGGDAATAGQLVDVAAARGVEAVVVEHGDGDHYGGVPALREALDVEVAVPAGDARFLREAGVAVDRELAGGERYYGFECVPAPGHTPDNMAYLADGTVIAGDTVAGVDSTFAAAGEWSGPLAPMTADYNADDDQARASVRRLLDHAVERVLVAHGTSVPADGSAAVETLVADL
ncbi:MAG: MBL fold metallo-hydrolase [Haloarculaceae archaeon]